MIFTVMLTSMLAVALIPVVTWSVQIIAALLIKDRTVPRLPGGPRPPVAIVIPAHDEEAAIAQTIENVKAQMRSSDRLVVVADNCADSTAVLAERAGSEVVVRRDEARRGKGYAVDAGLRYLSPDRVPEIVVILDAECSIVNPDGLDNLVRDCALRRAPVQAVNVVARVDGDDPRSRLAEFAWRLRGVMRPKGFQLLGLPCQLAGTGMAFPRDVLSRYDLATGHIAEDALLGSEMALDGHPAWLCPTASLLSTFPLTEQGRIEQRRRWIHGYFSVARVYIPKLLRRAVLCSDWRSLALAADLAIPPFGLLALITLLAVIIGALWFVLTDRIVPLVLSASCFALMLTTLLLSWTYQGRDLIGFREIAVAPSHLLKVVRMGLSYATKKRSGWIRSDRSSQKPPTK